MSTYIGARYVPKFMGTYDPTQAYENMCVVDNGMGTSYISTKLVPAGTPLTNTNYWAIYGASSGAIINLQNQIGDLNNLNTTDKTNLVNASNEILSQTQLLEKLIAPKDRQVIIIGDSYGMRNNPNYLSILTSLYPNNIRGTALSSYGFIPFTSGPEIGKSFISILNEYYTTQMTTAEKAEITDIVVLGGWNDAHHITLSEADINSLIAAIRSFVSQATSDYPNAKVWVGFVAWQTQYVLQNTPPGETYPSFNDLRSAELAYTSTLCPNIYHLDTARYVMRDIRNYDVTFFHPNADGGNRLAWAIIGDLFGHYSYNDKYSIDKSQLSDAGIVTTLDVCDVSICNDRTAFKLYANVSGTLTGSVVCTFADNLTIGTSEDVSIWATAMFGGSLDGNSYEGPLLCQINASNNTLTVYTPSVQSITSLSGRLIILGSFNNKYNM